MDAHIKQFSVGYLFEVTSLCTGILKDKIHVRLLEPSHAVWLLFDKCSNTSLHAHAYVYSGTRSINFVLSL